MLPTYLHKLDNLPMILTHIRDLEEFDGPILSELRDEFDQRYVEKWCALGENVVRTLVMRVEPEHISAYLAKEISMLDLLRIRTSGWGFLVDRSFGKIVAVYLINIVELPENYLPHSSAFHDE